MLSAGCYRIDGPFGPVGSSKAMRQELGMPEGTTGRDVPMGLGVPSNRGSQRAKERRCAAALAALAEMTGQQGPVVAIDDGSLDFLAQEISEQMVQELVRKWAAFKIGCPTTLKLAALAETIHLQTAVAALDG
jgi:hypothetical protein